MATGSKPVDRVDTTERLLKIADVSERLSVSVSMAHKLGATGELRSIRIGRAVRVKPSDLEAFREDVARER